MLPRALLRRALVSASLAVALVAPTQAYAEPVLGLQTPLAFTGQVQLVAQSATPTFALAAVSWPAGGDGPDGDFRIRVREAGVWGDWISLGWDLEHESEAVRSSSDPLVTNNATGIAVEYLGSHLPSGARLDLVPTSDASATLQSVGIRTAATLTQVPPCGPAPSGDGSNLTPEGVVVPMPAIHLRAEWQPVAKSETELTCNEKLEAVFVHHTATSDNDYSVDQVPAMLRAIQAYHLSRGSRDIDYNFLVDRFGNIWEGRYGGINYQPQGAHTLGFNKNTFGVSVLGYMTQPKTKPSATDLTRIADSIAALIAWKFAPFGIDPKSKVKLTSYISNPSKYSGIQYPNGSVATLDAISGHRDTYSTVCPGNYFYPYLPYIRTAVANELLAIKDVALSPASVNVAGATQPTLTAVLPASSTWSVAVADSAGLAVANAEGVADEQGNLAYSWDLKTVDGQPASVGQYQVNLTASLASGAQVVHSVPLVVGNLPAAPKAPKFSNKKKAKVVVTFAAPAVVFPAVARHWYRISKDSGHSWSSWKSTTAGKVTLTKLKAHRRFYLQVMDSNSIGKSSPTKTSFKPVR